MVAGRTGIQPAVRQGEGRWRHDAANQLSEFAPQLLDHVLFGQVDMLLAPVRSGVQYPGVELFVAPRLAAVAGQPVERVVLYEAALHGRIEGGLESQGDGPGRLHLHASGHGGELGRRGQQRCRLGRGHRDHHTAEGAVAAPFGVLQVPVLFATEDFGDAAAEVHRHVLEQAAGDGAHARHTDPARLFVG